MKEIFDEFKKYFDDENKEKAVSFIIDKLSSGEIDVIDLYTGILAPMLNNIECPVDDMRICIWKEHVKTGIVRTIVECSYPYIIAKRDELKLPKRGTAAVICPPDEYHDIGARIAADFFTVCGYETVYVGGNTPYKDFYNAIDRIKPDIVAISVSNYYHLVATKKMIDEIKGASPHPVKVVVGGYAFHDDVENKVSAIGADAYANSFEDVLRISEEEVTA